MHCDELFKLQCSDIAFGTESMTINITSSKTDQYRKGSTLVIARTGTRTYPVALMERYFSMGGLCTQEHGKVLWAKTLHQLLCDMGLWGYHVHIRHAAEDTLSCGLKVLN